MLETKLKWIVEVKCIRQKLYFNLCIWYCSFLLVCKFIFGICGFKDFNRIVLIFCPFLITQECQYKQFALHMLALIFCSPIWWSSVVTSECLYFSVIKSFSTYTVVGQCFIGLLLNLEDPKNICLSRDMRGLRNNTCFEIIPNSGTCFKCANIQFQYAYT